MFASICCTAAIAILLLKWRNEPLEDWTLSISLNTTISVLTTVARGTLLLSVSACLSQGKWLQFVRPSKLQAMDDFDEASRGPWGALTMIFRVNAYRGLSTLAAVVTVLALGIGPFTQQVVAYDQDSQDVQGHAVFNSAVNYTSGAPLLGLNVDLSASGPCCQHLSLDVYKLTTT